MAGWQKQTPSYHAISIETVTRLACYNIDMHNSTKRFDIFWQKYYREIKPTVDPKWHCGMGTNNNYETERWRNQAATYWLKAGKTKKYRIWVKRCDLSISVAVSFFPGSAEALDRWGAEMKDFWFPTFFVTFLPRHRQIRFSLCMSKLLRHFWHTA